MLRQPHHDIAAHEVHVWHLIAQGDAEAPLLRAADAMVSDDERQRLTRFGQERDRLLFVLSRVVIRTVLASYLDCDASAIRFAADQHGKPILQGGSTLQFNLTHTRGAVALAVSDGRDVGIDVEERTRAVEYVALAERYFAPDEASYLRTVRDDQLAATFFAIWTLKEAFVKGIGRGLSFPLDVFCFDLEAARLQRFRPLAEFVSPDWHFEQFELGERHCGAVAAHCPVNAPIHVDFHDWRTAFVA